MNYTDHIQDLEKRLIAALQATVPHTRDMKSLALWIFNMDAVLKDTFETIEKSDPTLKEAMAEFSVKETEKFDKWLLGILEKFYGEELKKFPDFDEAMLTQKEKT